MPHTVALVPRELLAELLPLAAESAPDAALFPYDETGPPPPGLPDADCVLRWTRSRRFTELVENGPRVRWLHTDSAGVDQVITPAVRAKQGLTLTNSGSAFAIPIAEFVLGWMLSVTHRLPEALDAQRAQQWRSFKQRELAGATVGIVGLGAIGQAVAVRAKAFGMTVLGLRQKAEPVSFVDEVLTGADGLDRLLSESDWIVLATALTDGTRALLGPAQIARMKPSAWLVNIARGAVVDEAALITALQNKQIAGACLDVFQQEPLPATSPLWEMENVYVAAHSSSGWTDGLHRRQIELYVSNLGRFTRGEPVVNVVDIARGY